jgi:hypothetical protein
VLNALSTLPRDAVLVLDDYQVIATPLIHQTLAFLLDHLPSRLHLVLTTRADPPLPLARLRAQGALTELRAAYTDLYNQRTMVERINSQAEALDILHPKLRSGRAIANRNTLTYVLINVRALQRIRTAVAEARPAAESVTLAA